MSETRADGTPVMLPARWFVAAAAPDPPPAAGTRTSPRAPAASARRPRIPPRNPAPRPWTPLRDEV